MSHWVSSRMPLNHTFFINKFQWIFDAIGYPINSSGWSTRLSMIWPCSFLQTHLPHLSIPTQSTILKYSLYALCSGDKHGKKSSWTLERRAKNERGRHRNRKRPKWGVQSAQPSVGHTNHTHQCWDNITQWGRDTWLLVLVLSVWFSWVSSGYYVLVSPHLKCWFRKTITAFQFRRFFFSMKDLNKVQIRPAE